MTDGSKSQITLLLLPSLLSLLLLILNINILQMLLYPDTMTYIWMEFQSMIAKLSVTKKTNAIALTITKPVKPVTSHLLLQIQNWKQITTEIHMIITKKLCQLILNRPELVGKFQMVKMVQEVIWSILNQSPNKHVRRIVIANLIAQTMSTTQGHKTVKFGVIWPWKVVDIKVLIVLPKINNWIHKIFYQLSTSLVWVFTHQSRNSKPRKSRETLTITKLKKFCLCNWMTESNFSWYNLPSQIWVSQKQKWGKFTWNQNLTNMKWQKTATTKMPWLKMMITINRLTWMLW